MITKQLSAMVLFCAFSLFAIVGCDAQQGNNSGDNGSLNLDNEMDKIAYSYGVLLGQNLKQQGMDDLNVNHLAAGIKDVLSGAEPKIEAEEAMNIVQTYQMQQMETARNEATVVEEQFLAENAQKEGINTTDSGLQYKVIEEGTGKSPSETDEVRVDYEGTLLDGKVFDSSYERGEPAEFPLNRVIPGWTEGLQLMKEGAKYEFYIPSRLAYGEQSPSPDIPANSTLKFIVELHEVK